jgi:hypothetical protein
LPWLQTGKHALRCPARARSRKFDPRRNHVAMISLRASRSAQPLLVRLLY